MYFKEKNNYLSKNKIEQYINIGISPSNGSPLAVPTTLKKVARRNRVNKGHHLVRRRPLSLPWVYSLQRELHEQMGGDSSSGRREAGSQLSVVPYL